MLRFYAGPGWILHAHSLPNVLPTETATPTHSPSVTGRHTSFYCASLYCAWQCCIFYKSKARFSTREKIMTCFVGVIWNQTYDNYKVCMYLYINTMPLTRRMQIWRIWLWLWNSLRQNALITPNTSCMYISFFSKETWNFMHRKDFKIHLL